MSGILNGNVTGNGRFTFGPNVVEDNMVLYLDAGNPMSYPGNGTTWTDISSNGSNATLLNGPTFSSNNCGVIIFDSTNDMATIPYNSNFNLCSILNWTISVWIRLNDTTGSFNSIISQWQQVFSGDAWILNHSNGTVGFIWAPFSVNNNMFASNTPLIVGNWTIVVLVKSGSDFSLYQNTNLVGSFNNSGTKSVTYQVEMGRYGGSGSYIGAQYSTVMIQHKALSISEIKQNYDSMKGRYGLL
jgi:hypothetical protein